MTILFCSLVFLLAGIIKGVLGMGLPTVAVALLVLVMTPGEASALLLIPSLVTNLWQLYGGPALGQLISRLWLMMVMLCLGTLLTVRWLTESENVFIPAMLGLILIVYGCMGLCAYRLPTVSESGGFVSGAVGFVTGLITGATSVFVVPAVPYLQAMNLGRERLIQALGLSFTVSTLTLGAGLSWQGALVIDDVKTSLLMLLPALAGLLAGQKLRTRLSETLFRRLFFIGLLLLGVFLFVRPFLRYE
ncbi:MULTISPECIES: sulfite exporter TauE/SafE family protein [Pseudomonas]|uniref:Probable membrane transporter protein n=1 Tax=Pseudomonas luteola TaxID=47886 RepID=A0ABS0MXI3_PSELU|nr:MULTISPECIES: sulfite exporter TauE/SafE family protein [Pseudomonas]MBH3441200.1 sulfite exporter TauE/SafE family protein [Pseudomonas luteola]MDN3237747.1 sulfite exporter TauE/SafE family protein [Pseudomonas sp. WAC2]